MATQVIGASRRFRTSVVLVALALAVAVFALAYEAGSALSAGKVQHIQPRPVHVSLSAQELRDLSKGVALSAGCRVKYGCQPRRRSSAKRSDGPHIPAGCRVKFGCN